MNNVKEMVEKQLRAMNADGLCNDECGCKLDDLMPCGNPLPTCSAALCRRADPEERNEEHPNVEWVMVPIGSNTAVRRAEPAAGEA